MPKQNNSKQICGDCTYFSRNPFCYIANDIVMEDTNACNEFEPYVPDLQRGVLNLLESEDG